MFGVGNEEHSHTAIGVGHVVPECGTKKTRPNYDRQEKSGDLKKMSAFKDD